MLRTHCVSKNGGFMLVSLTAVCPSGGQDLGQSLPPCGPPALALCGHLTPLSGYIHRETSLEHRAVPFPEMELHICMKQK